MSVRLIAAAVMVTTALAVETPAFCAPSLEAALGEQWKALPDWRGVWYLEGPLIFPGADRAVIAKASGAASAFEHGVTRGSYFTRAPYRPEYQKIYEERIAEARDQGIVEDPVENCYTPHGMPRLMGAAPGAVEFHITPNQTWIIWDAMNQTRRIYTDGRGFPSEDFAWPRIMGFSIGKWQGQTLIVETIWPKEGSFDRTGAPYSDQLRMVERIQKVDADTITVAMTIEDPVAFTQPWQVTRRYKRSAKKWESVAGTYCEFDADWRRGADGG